MPVQLQGAEIAWTDALLARARAHTIPQDARPAILQKTFNGLAAANRSFVSTEEFFTALIAAYPAALAADQDERLMKLRAPLLSGAQIMLGVTKIVSYNTIPIVHRNFVGMVIAKGAGSGLPRAKHLTDPATGLLASAAVAVWEYYLPDAAGGRMTCRNENGKLAFYYSNGAHGQNQYYYHLVTNLYGRPILRGGYPPDLHLKV